MAIRFHELPVGEFPMGLRPHIARLNRELRDISGLEGTISSDATTNRSDSSIARKTTPVVNIETVTQSAGTNNLYRTGLLADIGDPQIWAEVNGQPFFWEDRTAAGKGMRLHVAAKTDSAGTWAWNVMFRWGGV